MASKPKLHLYPPVKTSFVIAILLLFVGIISFIYADGLTILYQTWSNLTAPHITFMVKPEKVYLPADGTSQLYIDIDLKDQDGQNINSNDIIIAIIKGETSITQSNNPPPGISKRIFVQAPYQPQTVTLSFRYKQLIKTLDLEIFDPTPPATPIIKAPVDDTIFTTATPLVSGEATPNTKVEIYIDGLLNTTIPIEESGQFSGQLETAIKKGQHKLSATIVNEYGVRSDTSASITIEVHTPDPEIDLLNLRIKPNPVAVGKSFQIFVPMSSGTKAVVLMLDNHSYPLSDTNNSSVFSGNIPAPHAAGLYPISLEIITEGNDNVVAEKVASIAVN